EVMIKQFFDFYDYYIEVCTENSNKDGQPMTDPFGDRRGVFEYELLLQRFKKLKTKFESSQNLNNNASSSRSSSTSGSKHQQMDARTREIIHDAVALDSTTTANDATNLDDIFDDDNNDESNSSMDDDDDEQQLNDLEPIPSVPNAEQSNEKNST
ncbi:unnamed protein product, partial [Rotaria socialis]